MPAQFAALFVTSGDEKAFYRSELRAVKASAIAAIAKTTDRTTKVHLESVRDQVDKILDPDRAPAASGNTNRFAMELVELYLNPTSCWPDYTIKPD